MDLGSEAANSVLSTGSKVVESTATKTVESVVKGVEELTYILLKSLLDGIKNLSPNSNLKKLLDSGEGIKMTELSKEDIKGFRNEAKKLGVDLAVVKEKGKDTLTVLFSEKSMERVEKVLNKMIEVKMKSEEKGEQSERPSVKEKLKEIDEMKKSIKESPVHNKEVGAR